MRFIFFGLLTLVILGLITFHALNPAKVEVELPATSTPARVTPGPGVKTTDGGFFPAGFHGPSSAPYVRGPSGPPPQ